MEKPLELKRAVKVGYGKMKPQMDDGDAVHQALDAAKVRLQFSGIAQQFPPGRSGVPSSSQVAFNSPKPVRRATVGVFTTPTPTARLLEQFGIRPEVINNTLRSVPYSRAYPGQPRRASAVAAPKDGRSQSGWTKSPKSGVNPVFADLLETRPAPRPAATSTGAWRPGGGGGSGGSRTIRAGLSSAPARSGYITGMAASAAARARATSRQTSGQAHYPSPVLSRGVRGTVAIQTTEHLAAAEQRQPPQLQPQLQRGSQALVPDRVGRTIAGVSQPSPPSARRQSTAATSTNTTASAAAASTRAAPLRSNMIATARKTAGTPTQRALTYSEWLETQLGGRQPQGRKRSGGKLLQTKPQRGNGDDVDNGSGRLATALGSAMPPVSSQHPSAGIKARATPSTSPPIAPNAVELKNNRTIDHLSSSQSTPSAHSAASIAQQLLLPSMDFNRELTFLDPSDSGSRGDSEGSIAKGSLEADAAVTGIGAVAAYMPVPHFLSHESIESSSINLAAIPSFTSLAGAGRLFPNTRVVHTGTGSGMRSGVNSPVGRNGNDNGQSLALSGTAYDLDPDDDFDWASVLRDDMVRQESCTGAIEPSPSSMLWPLQPSVMSTTNANNSIVAAAFSLSAKRNASSERFPRGAMPPEGPLSATTERVTMWRTEEQAVANGAFDGRGAASSVAFSVFHPYSLTPEPTRGDVLIFGEEASRVERVGEQHQAEEWFRSEKKRAGEGAAAGRVSGDITQFNGYQSRADPTEYSRQQPSALPLSDAHRGPVPELLGIQTLGAEDAPVSHTHGSGTSELPLPSKTKVRSFMLSMSSEWIMEEGDGGGSGRASAAGTVVPGRMLVESGGAVAVESGGSIKRGHFPGDIASAADGTISSGMPGMSVQGASVTASPPGSEARPFWQPSPSLSPIPPPNTQVVWAMDAPRPSNSPRSPSPHSGEITPSTGVSPLVQLPNGQQAFSSTAAALPQPLIRHLSPNSRRLTQGEQSSNVVRSQTRSMSAPKPGSSGGDASPLLSSLTIESGHPQGFSSALARNLHDWAQTDGNADPSSVTCAAPTPGLASGLLVRSSGQSISRLPRGSNGVLKSWTSLASDAPWGGHRGSISGASTFSALSGPQAGGNYQYPSHGYVERAAVYGRWETAMMYDLELYSSMQVQGSLSPEAYNDPSYMTRSQTRPLLQWDGEVSGRPPPTPQRLSSPVSSQWAAGVSVNGAVHGFEPAEVRHGLRRPSASAWENTASPSVSVLGTNTSATPEPLLGATRGSSLPKRMLVRTSRSWSPLRVSSTAESAQNSVDAREGAVLSSSQAAHFRPQSGGDTLNVLVKILEEENSGRISTGPLELSNPTKAPDSVATVAAITVVRESGGDSFHPLRGSKSSFDSPRELSLGTWPSFREISRRGSNSSDSRSIGGFASHRRGRPSTENAHQSPLQQQQANNHVSQVASQDVCRAGAQPIQSDLETSGSLEALGEHLSPIPISGERKKPLLVAALALGGASGTIEKRGGAGEDGGGEDGACLSCVYYNPLAASITAEPTLSSQQPALYDIEVDEQETSASATRFETSAGPAVYANSGTGEDDRRTAGHHLLADTGRKQLPPRQSALLPPPEVGDGTWNYQPRSRRAQSTLPTSAGSIAVIGVAPVLRVEGNQAQQQHRLHDFAVHRSPPAKCSTACGSDAESKSVTSTTPSFVRGLECDADVTAAVAVETDSHNVEAVPHPFVQPSDPGLAPNDSLSSFVSDGPHQLVSKAALLGRSAGAYGVGMHGLSLHGPPLPVSDAAEWESVAFISRGAGATEEQRQPSSNGGSQVKRTTPLTYTPPSLESIQRLLESDLPSSAIAAAVGVLAGSLPRSWVPERMAAVPSRPDEHTLSSEQGAVRRSDSVQGHCSLLWPVARPPSGGAGSASRIPPTSGITCAPGLSSSNDAQLGIDADGVSVARRCGLSQSLEGRTGGSETLTRSYIALLTLAGGCDMPPKPLQKDGEIAPFPFARGHTEEATEVAMSTDHVDVHAVTLPRAGTARHGEDPLGRAVRFIAQSMLIVLAGAAGATAVASSANAIFVRPEDLPHENGTSIFYAKYPRQKRLARTLHR